MGRWRGRSGASMALPTASRTEPPRPAIAALDSTSTAPPLLAFDVPRVRHTNASTGVLPQEARRAAHSCRRGRSETSQPRRRGEQTDASRNGTKCAQSRAAGQPAGGPGQHCESWLWELGGQSPARPTARVRGRPRGLRLVGRRPPLRSKRTLRAGTTHRSPAAPGAGRRGPDALQAAYASPGALTHGNMSQSTRSLAPAFVNCPSPSSPDTAQADAVRPAYAPAPPAAPAAASRLQEERPARRAAQLGHPPRPPQKSVAPAQYRAAQALGER